MSKSLFFLKSSFDIDLSRSVVLSNLNGSNPVAKTYKIIPILYNSYDSVFVFVLKNEGEK